MCQNALFVLGLLSCSAFNDQDQCLKPLGHPLLDVLPIKSGLLRLSSFYEKK